MQNEKKELSDVSDTLVQACPVGNECWVIMKMMTMMMMMQKKRADRPPGFPSDRGTGDRAIHV